MSVRILVGDVRSRLADLADESVQCVCTSPPYWGLRDYGVAGQIGLEESPEEYVAEMVGVFRDVRRVLREDGTLWLNLGDSYAGSWGAQSREHAGKHAPNVSALSANQVKAAQIRENGTGSLSRTPGLKAKDLVGAPWRVAFALQADGWWLRSDIVWNKPNPMPESVTDRPTKAHEYVFLMTKSASYFFDADAVREPATDSGRENGRDGRDEDEQARPPGSRPRTLARIDYRELGRNIRTVWTIPSHPFAEAHFATFPPALAERCIRAGTSEKGACGKCGAPWEREVERTAMVVERSDRTHDLGRTRTSGTMVEPPRSTTTGWTPTCACAADVAPCVVLDPFGGAGTTGLVAQRLGRDAVLVELNPTYAAMAERRIREDAPMFAKVTAEAAS